MPAKMAYLMLRREPEYRMMCFHDGLVAAGFLVNLREPRSIKPGDVMLTWNRSGSNEVLANCFEQGGGTVIVTENGYIGEDEDKRHLYALALRGHNGSGQWYVGPEDRLQKFKIELQPWREAGHHILICPNRQIGPRIYRQPLNFAEQAAIYIRQHTSRPIHIRPHPGNWQVNPPKIPLEADLIGAWACVVWSSSAGVRALSLGIPVFYKAHYWICSDAASDNLAQIESPTMLDRKPSFHNMSWAQWSLREIGKGEPFHHLLASHQ